MASKDEFVTKIKGQLDEWNAEIGKLEDKMAKAGDETRKDLQPYLAKTQEARDALVSKLNELKNSSEASWESSKDEVEHVWKTFMQSVNYFKSQL
jgi:predicted  nucleic acid-binding Zn-ribbon protein